MRCALLVCSGCAFNCYYAMLLRHPQLVASAEHYATHGRMWRSLLLLLRYHSPEMAARLADEAFDGDALIALCFRHLFASLPCGGGPEGVGEAADGEGSTVREGGGSPSSHEPSRRWEEVFLLWDALLLGQGDAMLLWLTLAYCLEHRYDEIAVLALHALLASISAVSKRCF